MKIFIGNLKLQLDPNICQETDSILHGSWIKRHDKGFFLLFFNQTTIFYPKMMEWRKYVYAIKLVHHYL